MYNLNIDIKRRIKMIQIISGNVVALIASTLMVISGSLKERNKIIYVQAI